MSTVNVTVKVEKEMGEVETRVMKFYAHATIAEAENRIRTLCCLIGGGLKDANDVIPLENVTIGDLFGPVVFDGGKSVVTLGRVDCGNLFCTYLSERPILQHSVDTIFLVMSDALFRVVILFAFGILLVILFVMFFFFV